MDKILYKNISRLCKEKYITLNDLQLLMGYDSNYDNFLNSKFISPSFPDLIKTAKILGVDTAALLSFSDPDNEMTTIEKLTNVFVDKLITDTEFNKISWSPLTWSMIKEIEVKFPYDYYDIEYLLKDSIHTINYDLTGYFTQYGIAKFFVIIFLDKDTKRPIDSKYYVLVKANEYTPLCIDNDRSSSLFCSIYYRSEVALKTSNSDSDALKVLYNYVNNVEPDKSDESILYNDYKLDIDDLDDDDDELDIDDLNFDD